LAEGSGDLLTQYRLRPCFRPVPVSVPLGDIKIRLLKDIGRVETPLEPTVHPELDHPAQPIPVPRKQFAKRSLVASLHAANQGFGLTRVARHG
jgi:hypothetical protein